MNIILTLQSLGNWLTPIMKFFTSLGYEEFYLIVMPALYWCVDALFGARLAVMLALTSGVNTLLKLAFHSPRPFWVSDQVRALSAETSFGIPSGHAQNAVALWGLAAAHIRKRWAWIAAGVIAFLIGLSRLYLAVHFPVDVLTGWLVGGLLLWLFLRYESRALDWFKGISLSGQIFCILGVSAVILALGLGLIAVFGSWQMPAAWVENAARAGAEPEGLRPSGVTTSAGLTLGLLFGLLHLHRLGGFNARGAWWRRVVRYILGMVGTLALWAGLKAVFPSGDALLPQTLRLLRYALVGYWVAAGAPWLFLRLRLAETGEA